MLNIIYIKSSNTINIKNVLRSLDGTSGSSTEILSAIVIKTLTINYLHLRVVYTSPFPWYKPHSGSRSHRSTHPPTTEYTARHDSYCKQRRLARLPLLLALVITSHCKSSGAEYWARPATAASQRAAVCLV